MGKLFGGGKEKSTTQETVTNLPSWVRELQEGYGEDVSWLRDLAKEAYEGGGIGGTPDDPAQWDEAENMIREGGQNFQGGMEELIARLGGKDYESGYTDDVVDTTLAGMQRQADRERLAREGRAASVGGTSNTRAAVGNAVAENLSGMNMAEMEAKLRDEGFRFGSEMDLENAGLTKETLESMLGGGLQTGGAIGGIGDDRLALEQERMDEEQSRLSWLGGMFGQSSPLGIGAGTGTTSGTTTQPKPSTFSQILGAGSTILGGFLSDEQAKEDIVAMEVGLDALKDVKPATYKYKEGMPTDKKGRTAGLMAQDLEHIPGAVSMGIDGYRRVDPYPVLATVVQAVKELDARTGGR